MTQPNESHEPPPSPGLQLTRGQVILVILGILVFIAIAVVVTDGLSPHDRPQPASDTKP